MLILLFTLKMPPEESRYVAYSKRFWREGEKRVEREETREIGREGKVREGET